MRTQIQPDMALVPPGHMPLPPRVAGSRPNSRPLIQRRATPAELVEARQELESAGLKVPFSDAWDDWDDWDPEDDVEVLPEPHARFAARGSFTAALGEKGILGLSCTGASSMLESRQSMSMEERMLEALDSRPGVVQGACLSWERGEVLGTGSMGKVFRALDQRNGQLIAVKEVPLSESNSEHMKVRQQLETEVRICQTVHHPRVVKYFGHDYVKENLYIYLEYMPGGSLTQVIGQFGPLDESFIAVCTRDLLLGLEYLHTREVPVVHRDIKGGNILVGLDCKMKLADFGCSKMSEMTQTHVMKGSIPWMAPEVIMQNGYGRKADIWSFGCTMIEMATGHKPWGNLDNPINAMRKIGMSKETPLFPKEGFSETCQSFVARCLQRKKDERPTASHLLQDDFVVDLLPSEDF